MGEMVGPRLTLAYAVLELERLLGHLRRCPECYTNEPCLEKHFLVKDVQGKTEKARCIAHEIVPRFDDGSVYVVGVHGPAPPPQVARPAPERSQPPASTGGGEQG